MELRLSSREQHLITESQTVMLSALSARCVDDWRQAVLQRLCAVVGADRGMLLMPSAESRLVHAEGFTPAEVDEYEAVFPNDPGRALVRGLGLEVWTHPRLLGPNPDVFYKSWVYHEFYRPRQLGDGIGYVVESADRISYAVLKLHHERPGTRNFGERGRALLTLLLPAFKAGVRSLARAPKSRVLTAVIDRLEDGVALFDEGGTHLHRNPALERILCADPQRTLIESAIDEVRRSLSFVCTASRVADPVCAGMAAGTPYKRAVTTAAGRYEAWGTLAHDTSAFGGMVIVVFVRASGVTPAAITAAARHFGLTPRETQVLSRVAHGAAAKEIAAALGISVNTARRHTEAIMRKCGVHSRNAVCHLVLSLSRTPDY